ncbi:MAG: hypothetical protein HWN79_12735, partial [Candidatus Lokiarchaeota archaeon]|nr:hypothetical protein [Candidatus Lokiarchaeota archaeon]
MLGQDFYPLTGTFREPLLILEWIIVFLISEVAFLLYMRVKNKEMKLSNIIEKAYITFLLSYSLMGIFYIFGDYYMETQFSRLIVFNIGYILRMIMGLVFIYQIEKYQTIFRKYVFSKIFLVFTILSVVLSFTAIEFTQYSSLVLFWIPIFSIFLIYTIKFLKKPSEKQEIHNLRTKIYFSILGGILIGLGFGVTSDPFLIAFGLSLRIVGQIFQIVGIVVLAIFFTSLPSLSEQDWKNKIDKLFLMRASGICVYYKFFRDKTSKRDEQNISGAINSIKMILQEISHNDGEMVIEKEGKVLITSQGKYITGVI